MLNLEKQDLNSQLIHKNRCDKCRAAKRPKCVCGGMIDAVEEEIELDAQNQRKKLIDTIEAKTLEADLRTQSKDKTPDTVSVARPSEDGLHIDNNNMLGRLTLTFMYKAGSFELRKYVDAILRELEEFKREHGITVNCAQFEKDSAGNLLSLRIILPQAYLYHDFISRLASKNILPSYHIDKENKTLYQPKSHFTFFSPLATRPTFSPFTKKRKTREEEEKERRSTLLPSPFRTVLKPTF